MSNDRIRGSFLPAGGEQPEPSSALLYIEDEAGALRVEVCFARAQVRAAYAEHQGTDEASRQAALGHVETSGLPEVSRLRPRVVSGWAAGRIVDIMTGDQRIRQQDLDAFYRTNPILMLDMPESPEEGDRAFIWVCDENEDCFVWIVPSRVGVRALIKKYRPMFEDQAFCEAWLELVAGCALPETDAVQGVLCIEGSAAFALVCMHFCLDERKSQSS